MIYVDINHVVRFFSQKNTQHKSLAVLGHRTFLFTLTAVNTYCIPPDYTVNQTMPIMPCLDRLTRSAVTVAYSCWSTLPARSFTLINLESKYIF